MNALPRPWILVPAKDFSRAKSRLSPALGAAERAELARSMLARVVSAALASACAGGVAVATESETVEAVARALGAEVVRDRASGPLGAIVDLAIEDLVRRGARSVVVLMSDLPLFEPGDLADLVRSLADNDVVVAPDAREGNTNALGLAVPGAFRTSFGSGASFRRHLDDARAASLRCAVHRSRGLAVDVDVPEDLAALQGARVAFPSRTS